MAGNRQHFFRLASRGLVLCFAALAITGCSHRVLTFFFTGVPDPNAAPVEEVATVEEVQAAVIRDIPEQPDFTHGPWVTHQCDLCHVPRAGGRFNAIQTSGSSARLSFPRAELCAGCHADERFSKVASPLYRHGPVVNGDCISCHSPHKSRRQFMLFGSNNRDLCENCHTGVTAPASALHVNSSDTDCVDCHNPHASELPMLLRAGVSQ